VSARERLRQVQEQLGVAAKKSLGQNFLVSDIVIERIIAAVRATEPEALIEIGPGPGALTYFLRQMNLPLQLIELDHLIAAYWRDQGLSVLEEDALKIQWRDLYAPGKKTVLVSNLPYQISSSIVIERSLEEAGVADMVLMFQKEVAQRIRASAQSEAYGLLSVIAQTFWKIETVSEAGPKDFDPAPRVASRVLAFHRREAPLRRRQSFLNFVKASFAQRRKLLKSNLSDLCHQKKLSAENLVGWLQEMGFKETARAEELSPAQFVQLYKKFGFEE
jgi:16S rRNA (adenine1518-N6/adenine1519-N6)-dimethyltransferase